MVRRLLVAVALACSLARPVAAAPSPAPAPAPTTAKAPTAASTTAAKPALDWRSRLAVAVRDLQKTDPALLARLEQLQPTRGVDDELSFAAEGLHDKRAATVLLRRLLQGKDPADVRAAIVDALPLTGGDWQEGAAAMVGLDASPLVRKKLIEVMRYAEPPHSVTGLRHGFKDEDPAVNVAAARAAGFHKHGDELFTELYSATFDADGDLRAAAVQALGMLKLPRSREILVKALADDDREVRLQAFLALEQLDPDGLLAMPELDRLAKDRKSHRIARKAQLLLQKRRALHKSGKRVTVATPGRPGSSASTSAPVAAAP